MTHLTEDQVADDLDCISKYKNKNERLAWKRKLMKLHELMSDKLHPIEEKILVLLEEKEVVLQEVLTLRKQMSRECVHPKDFLVHNGNRIQCKFCNVSLSLPNFKLKESDE